MAEYIEREAAIEAISKLEFVAMDVIAAESINGAFQIVTRYMDKQLRKLPAADVLPRDEGIRIGAELAAMHGATPTEQELEKAYFDGLEYGMKRRDVRPVVRGKWIYDHWCEFKCSNCGAWSKSEPYRGRENFCPNCGADMREES